MSGLKGIGYVLVSEMGYTWEELKNELLADALYTYAIWEKQQEEKQDRIEKQKQKAPG